MVAKVYIHRVTDNEGNICARVSDLQNLVAELAFQVNEFEPANTAEQLVARGMRNAYTDVLERLTTIGEKTTQDLDTVADNGLEHNTPDEDGQNAKG